MRDREETMKLRTIGGRLTLGSVFKMFVAAWLISWSLLFGAAVLAVVLSTIVTGQIAVNGVVVHGIGPALSAIVPFVILLPVVIVVQAFIVGGILTFGIWLYQLNRPLQVVAEGEKAPG
jgi:hypothetical protein